MIILKIPKKSIKAKFINQFVINFTIKTTIMEDIIQKEDREEIQRTIDKFLSILSPLQKEALQFKTVPANYKILFGALCLAALLLIILLVRVAVDMAKN